VFLSFRRRRSVSVIPTKEESDFGIVNYSPTVGPLK
jgi:hypothetical protein